MMSLPISSVVAGLLLNVVGANGADDNTTYSACPLIGAYYPPPTLSKSPDTITELGKKLTKTFDDIVKNSGSEDYGPITSNTTSFSVVLFSGAESAQDDPAFFEYHWTSPEDWRGTKINVTTDTKYPIGDLTMIFTVYSWVIEMGESWEKPITDYLPELEKLEHASTWRDVTIGSLAGQLSGLVRESGACVIGQSCDLDDFLDRLGDKRFLFLPDTTPIVSYAAFQLLAFAMQKHSKADDFAGVLKNAILSPLNMSETGLLNKRTKDIFAGGDLDLSQSGEPAAVSFFSSIRDLSRAGHSMLSSTLVSAGTTRRWLRADADTSNLVNGVGRPWELYRYADTATSPVLDVQTKSGTLGQYASYFGLAPDFNTGFAILAHDSTVADGKLDLNVYADGVSEALEALQGVAALETAARFGGTYEDGSHSTAVLNITDNGPGLQVQKLEVNGTDLKAETAKKMGIKAAALDFRLYPTNVEDGSKFQFVAVFQDKDAPVDQGTPTCITWQQVGAVTGVDYIFNFDIAKDGTASRLEIASAGIGLAKAA